MKKSTILPTVLALAGLLGVFLYRRSQGSSGESGTPYTLGQGVDPNLKPAGEKESTGRSLPKVEVGTPMRIKDPNPSGNALERILSRYQEAVKRLKGNRGFPSRAAGWAALHYDEARLWALAYRQDAHDWAREAGTDQQLDLDTRRLAVFVMGVLAEQGDKELELLLLGIASDLNHPIAEEALVWLSEADGPGTHRDLYTTLALRGSTVAIDTLSYWEDPANERILAEIAAKQGVSGEPLRDVAYMAARSLGLLSQLKSTQWAEEVDKILLATGKEARFNSTPWALRVSARKGMASVLPVMKERLDRTEAEYRKYYPLDSRDNPSPLESAFGRDFNLGKIDAYYDDVLISYAANGGTLTELQKIRLTGLGYLGDPATNLTRLLSAGQ